MVRVLLEVQLDREVDLLDAGGYADGHLLGHERLRAAAGHASLDRLRRPRAAALGPSRRALEGYVMCN